MLSGLLLIVLGLVIYLQPRIVVAMVAGMLIAAGLSIVLLSWRLRRMVRSAGQAPSGSLRMMLGYTIMLRLF